MKSTVTNFLAGAARRGGAAVPLALAAVAALAVFGVPADAWAQDAKPTLNSGDTAWMITATALVLLMTIPGLALFYGGMVRKKNVLSTVMQSFAITCMISIIWVIVGYSIAFSGSGAYFGNLDNLFLKGVTAGSLSGTIPETVFIVFQMTFAIITPALICGAFADRMKFSSMLVFIALWSVIVYAPICHWVWDSDGWLYKMGALDFAGGTVVHINSGVAGLVACIILGKRLGYGTTNMAPHNLVLSVIGAALLWVGWFGFNAGSSLTAGTGAGMAMLVTQLASATAAFVWMLIEWAHREKPSVLGIISGAIAGLVAITPASGFVGVFGAFVIGIAAAFVCYFAVTVLKRALKYDDSLDVFGIHGVGGIVGAILTGVFATQAITGAKDPVGWIDGNVAQMWPQIAGILGTIAWSAVATAVILLIVKAVMGLRVSENVERGSLDIELHGETVHE